MIVLLKERSLKSVSFHCLFAVISIWRKINILKLDRDCMEASAVRDPEKCNKNFYDQMNLLWSRSDFCYLLVLLSVGEPKDRLECNEELV